MNKSGLSFVIFCIIIGWLLDVFSSYVGITMGLAEGSPFFHIFPAMWMIILLCMAVGIYLSKKVPVLIRKILLFWVIILSFMPSCWNSAGLILEVLL